MASKEGTPSLEAAKNYCCFGYSASNDAHCTICSKTFKAKDSWNCQLHMMRDHPYLCGYDEVKKHGSSTKLLEKERAWDKAHEPDQPVRGMLAFFQRDPVVKAVDKPSVISQSQRAIIVAGLCVGLFGLSILQNVGMSILLGALGFSVVGLSQRTLNRDLAKLCMVASFLLSLVLLPQSLLSLRLQQMLRGCSVLLGAF
jgi:hypothetical protein